MAIDVQTSGSAVALIPMGDGGVPANSQKANILIVDDRPDKLVSLEVALESLNQNILLARSGKEALRCLLRQDFALILLDVNMPGIDGFETAALIRQRARSETTPIIFGSALNDAENHISRGYSLGAVDYIMTPVVPEILRAKVSVFVDLARKTEQVKRQAEERALFVVAQAARAEAEASQERSAFLAEASNVLAGSLDYEGSFGSLAGLCVPRLADFCIIDMIEENGAIHQVAVSHRDRAWEPRLRELVAPSRNATSAGHGTASVFQTGKSQLETDVTDAILGDLFPQLHEGELDRALHPASFITVPLPARGRILGAITLVSTDPDRAWGPAELSLAEAFGQRAALALDNVRLYEAAHHARMEAERASQAKDQFLAMLSHELRTPLTPVLNTVAFLEGEQLAEPIREAVQVIRRNVELEARLIDDLLDLTRVSKGKVQLNLELADAHALIRSTVEICRGEIEDHGLVLDLFLEAKRSYLRADTARLQQIFWNLIKNAVKFTPQGGRLTIRTSDGSDGRLNVSVIDTGIGIEPALVSKIFNAFEQVGEGERFGGLGLGLAITKALVAMHRGEIAASSEGTNTGACFTVRLPTEDAPTQETLDATVNEPDAPERVVLSILLVEDHEDTSRSLVRLLRKRGYEVRAAASVAAGLAMAVEAHFDLLISDMGLPDGTGIDLMRELSATREVCGIALSGYGMEEDINRSKGVGFREHLTKPIDISRLDAIIQRVGRSCKASE